MRIPASTGNIRIRVCAVFLIGAMSIGLFGCESKTVNVVAQPKLVLVIVVDQFRYDFLERFRDHFGTGGFRRLMDDGAFFTNANYTYVPTFTAPGHAAVFTGSVPAQNGIVGNNYFDRTTGTNKIMVSDEGANIVTSYGKQSNTKFLRPASPRVLIGTTLGDQMRLANNFKSKVVALSLKDRAAILPGGKEANGAYWYDQSSGTMVSSDFYFPTMPEWVNKFNAQRIPDKSFDKLWDKALGPEAYSTTEAQVPDIKGSPLIERHFPYKINGGEKTPSEGFYTEFQYTPFASDYLAEFAKAAIEGESLGTDKYTDLLAISFSTTDLVGHSYGPDSEEVEDIYIQLDRTLADLFTYVDQKVGLSNTIIAMTGDHGVTPVPELLKVNKLDAEVIDPNKCKAAVNDALDKRYSAGKAAAATPTKGKTETTPSPAPATPGANPQSWILDIVNDQVYFDKKVIEARHADESEVEHIAGEALLTVPGISRYFTRTQILNGQVPQGRLGMQITNGFNPSRSGDVWLITKPFHFVAEGAITTTHGGPYNYDTHVPVILYGPGIKANRYYTECSPSDITPTIAALIGVEPPATRVGRVLSEALGPQ